MIKLAAVKKWLYLISIMLFFVANVNATNSDFFGVREVDAAKGVVQAEKVSGSYLLEFQSGKFYAGKGLEFRMM